MATRVLLVSHETTLSGAPIQLVDLAIYLRANAWAPTVVAPEEGPITEKLRAAQVEVAIEPELLLDPKHSTLRRLVKGNDVVIANTIATWQAIQAAHLEGVPGIWYLHETLVGQRLITQIPQIKPSLALADALVVPTASTAAVYEMWARRCPVVIPYGIALPCVSRGLRTSDRTVFVTLGSYERRKGQDLLLEAVEHLDPVLRAQALFRMAGRNLDELFYESFQRAAARVKEVELLGAIDHSESLNVLAEANILLLPSRDETMPIVILEAMGLGKPVITTDVGGIREWLRDGLNALLVPPENPLALAEAIKRCLCDPEVVRILGATGKRTYETHFTIDRYGAGFERVIQEVLNQRRGRVELDIRKLGWPDRYARWVHDYDTFSAPDRAELERGLRSLREQPVISVLLPVYNPDRKLLRQAIDSVKNQTYQKWELCLADDASTDPRVRPFLEAEAANNERVRVVFRKANGHIAACSNSALALATGSWCALLDQDDALAPNALAEVAAEIARDPGIGLIYSDEDKIDLDGARSFPFFKTDWNPELFLAQNYINHLGAFRTSLLREIGGFRQGFEGSQDYDLTLRCVERLQPEQIRHIPRILYHWRTVPGSLADAPGAKPYAREAARLAIAEHLGRCSVRARVEPCPENPESHRVVYEVPSPAPLVSIVIPSRDRLAFLRRCIDSVRTRTEYGPLEFVIVDNGSSEPETVDYLKHLATFDDNTRVVYNDGDFNFSRLINNGARHVRGSLLLLLNNDVEATEAGWLTEMVSHVMRDRVGAVGARLWYPDNTLQHGGVVLGLGGVAGHAHHRVPRGHPGYFNRAFLQQDCSAVTAACMLVRKSLFEKLGGLNELDLGINFSDVDFCLRLREHGWRIIWTPYANLVHHESISRGTRPNRPQQEVFMQEATYMQRRWGRELLTDPFYNANLSLELPAFYPAFPPRQLRL